MIYEMRTYHVNSGKMDALLSRFREHSCTLLEKHGIKLIGFWTNSMGGRSDQMIWMIAYKNYAHREQAWNAFASDPEWKSVKADSERKGLLVSFFTNQILQPTDFSPLQ